MRRGRKIQVGEEMHIAQIDLNTGEDSQPADDKAQGTGHATQNSKLGNYKTTNITGFIAVEGSGTWQLNVFCFVQNILIF